MLGTTGRVLLPLQGPHPGGTGLILGSPGTGGAHRGGRVQVELVPSHFSPNPCLLSFPVPPAARRSSKYLIFLNYFSPLALCLLLMVPGEEEGSRPGCKKSSSGGIAKGFKEFGAACFPPELCSPGRGCRGKVLSSPRTSGWRCHWRGHQGQAVPRALPVGHHPGCLLSLHMRELIFPYLGGIWCPAVPKKRKKNKK